MQTIYPAINNRKFQAQTFQQMHKIATPYIQTDQAICFDGQSVIDGTISTLGDALDKAAKDALVEILKKPMDIGVKLLQR